MNRKFRACLRPAARAGRLVRPPAWAGRLVRAGLAGVLAVPVVTVAALGTASPAMALGNGLALTPPMGFNDWNAYGCNVSEQLIEQTALAMHNDGMQAAGYQYVNIDDCWMASQPRLSRATWCRTRPSSPTASPATAGYVHSQGLKLGIYEDAGTATCAGFPGSLGHEQHRRETVRLLGRRLPQVRQLQHPVQQLPGQSHQQVAQTLTPDARRAGRHRPPDRVQHVQRVGFERPAVDLGAPASATCGAPPATSSANFGSMLNIFHSNVGLASYAGPGRVERPGHAGGRQRDDRDREPRRSSACGRRWPPR